MKKFIFVIISLLTLSFAEVVEVRNIQENSTNNLKMVMDLSTGDIEVFENKLLKSIPAHYEMFSSQIKSLKVVVVVSGDAYKFFTKELSHSPYKNDTTLRLMQENLERRLKSLVDLYNVKFELCGLGLEKREISKNAMYNFAEVVYSSTSALIEWQNRGYAYIPVK
ncbi:MAG: DsrE family protein [Campylobacterales bacterium]|nr:DsrE family protein [Campylobacterales bacterium]